MGVSQSLQWYLLQAFLFLGPEEDTLVIATHGIVKKTQITHLKEIAKAGRS